MWSESIFHLNLGHPATIINLQRSVPTVSKILSALGQLITPLKNDILPKVGGVLKNSEKNLSAHVKNKSCLLVKRLCNSRFKKGSQNQFFPIVWETQLPILVLTVSFKS